MSAASKAEQSHGGVCLRTFTRACAYSGSYGFVCPALYLFVSSSFLRWGVWMRKVEVCTSTNAREPYFDRLHIYVHAGGAI